MLVLRQAVRVLSRILVAFPLLLVGVTSVIVPIWKTTAAIIANYVMMILFFCGLPLLDQMLHIARGAWVSATDT